MDEFILPSFLDNQSADEIHERMLSVLPKDMDKGEGGFPWDFTRPTAIEIARMTEYVLTEAIKNLTPLWAYAPILDYHANNKMLPRREAVCAKVVITVAGKANTVIPKGCVFATQATAENPSIEFASDEEQTIPSLGTVDINATAVVGGENGNVTAGSIKLLSIPIEGVESVTNTEAASGGVDEENDEELRNRILDFDRNLEWSYIGSTQDYKRWTESVAGVGSAVIVEPTDDSGLITILITDSSGAPADSELCNKVFNFIMRPDDKAQRLAPINAQISVTGPTVVAINIEATIILTEDYTIEMVKDSFVTRLQEYLKEITDTVYYNKVLSILVETNGVKDVSSLMVNDVKTNISIASGSIASTNASKVVLSNE